MDQDFPPGLSPPAEPAFLGVERSLTGRRWLARPHDPRHAAALSLKLGAPDVLGRLLAARGVLPEEAPRWLEPKLRDWLGDPSALRDMDAAADRLARAVLTGERVALLGDYDVDGATSTALLVRFLRAFGVEPLVHIPDRQREGYGPSEAAVRSLAARGAGLLITLDCGTLAHAALAAAGPLGLDVIVVDHHLAEPELPAVHAVINPNRLDEEGGLGHLAAVGCAFLLAVATARVLRGRVAAPLPDLLQLLDLVALGTVCDVVPMRGVNRAFVAQGLRVMARRGNAGLAALADAGGLTAAPGCYHLGFVLGPRVNAGGRVGRSELGAQLLACDDAATAALLAEELCRYNRERQAIEAAVQAAAGAAIRDPDAPVIVAVGRDWHAGVIGIVAGRLKDTHRRPAVVIGHDGVVGKGSGRSIPGVDLGAAVVAAKQAGLLVNGGGHAMAAGLTVAADRIGELERFLCARLAPAVAAAGDRAALRLDGAVGVGGANLGLVRLIEGAGPYGPGHPQPRLALADARIAWAEVVGERHLKLALEGAGGERLAAIAFRALDGPLGPALRTARGAAHHLAGQLAADEWRGERRLQFVVEDAAPVPAQAAAAW